MSYITYSYNEEQTLWNNFCFMVLFWGTLSEGKIKVPLCSCILVAQVAAALWASIFEIPKNTLSSQVRHSSVVSFRISDCLV